VEEVEAVELPEAPPEEEEASEEPLEGVEASEVPLEEGEASEEAEAVEISEAADITFDIFKKQSTIVFTFYNYLNYVDFVLCVTCSGY
jgi:hypothetical protein